MEKVITEHQNSSGSSGHGYHNLKSTKVQNTGLVQISIGYIRTCKRVKGGVDGYR